ncbi:MAG TPA: DNA-processing protein DprA [Dokdonella sp.]
MDVETNRAELEAWLILLRTPGFGPAALRERIGRCGSAAAALAEARRAGSTSADARDWLRAPRREAIDADLAWLAEPGHTLLRFDEDDFPALLGAMPSPPAALFAVGRVEALWLPQVAVVGSRSASHAGLATASAFARALTGAGFAITSGLAEGIDGAAHAAALDAGGATIAVLGTGPDRVYPRRHRELAARIEAGGALVSEFAPGTPARPAHFPRRNRIIAGLALGTLVVEAGLCSGSLITAREAADAGRDVFAVPGSIRNPLARGCHQLIRSGARLVEDAAELVAELAPAARNLGLRLRERLAGDAPAGASDQAGDALACDPDRTKVLTALGTDELGVDELAQRTGLPVPALSAALLMLELDGAVVATGGGAYARREDRARR